MPSIAAASRLQASTWPSASQIDQAFAGLVENRGELHAGDLQGPAGFVALGPGRA